MGAASTCTVTLGVSSIEITRTVAAGNSPELFPKVAISGVFPVKINDSANMEAATRSMWMYRFAKMIIIDIVMNDGSSVNFDLQEVTNQSGWTANLAGQQQCIADINAWLVL